MACWIIFTDAGKRTDWWVVANTDEITGTIVKVKRSFYTEYMEMIPGYNQNLEKLMDVNEKESFNRQYDRDFAAYKKWESEGKFEYTGPDREYNYIKYDLLWGNKKLSIRK